MIKVFALVGPIFTVIFILNSILLPQDRDGDHYQNSQPSYSGAYSHIEP